MATSSTNPNYTLIDTNYEREKNLKRLVDERQAETAKWKAIDAAREEKKRIEDEEKAEIAESERIADELHQIALAKSKRWEWVWQVAIVLGCLCWFCIRVCWFVVMFCLNTLGLFIGLKVGGSIWNSSLRK
jgi:hypothetical protein